MSEYTGVINIHGKDYQTVALRLSQFREKHPIESGWAIKTEKVELSEMGVIFRCEILNECGVLVATGHAEEKWDSSQINKTSALENCETSAVGRALAFAGYGGTQIATAEEVANAVHQQNNPPKSTNQKPPESVPVVQKGADYTPEYLEFKAWVEKDLGDKTPDVLAELITRKCFKNKLEMFSCHDLKYFERLVETVEQIAEEKGLLVKPF